ncbi:hypothetical protein LLG39_08900 [bacterium]|nr:hypothetical protein [bacterium]
MSVTTLFLNTHNFAPSQFFSHAANSATVFNGKLLFARSTGLFESAGDNDGLDENDEPIPINAWVVLPVTDLEYNGQKTPRSLVLGGYINGQLVASVTDEKDITKNYTTEAMLSYDGTKVGLDSDQRSRFFKLKITNVDGADFSLKNADLVFIPGPERRK